MMREISQPFEEVENAQPEDYLIYSRREIFTIFEVSCLIIGKDPERVTGNALAKSRTLDGLAWGACREHKETYIFGAEHGGIIRNMMKICGKSKMSDPITIEQAREMTGLLRRKWPKELLQETIMERSRRRLKRLRQLGGEYEEHGDRYMVTLREGALTALIEEEKTMLHPAYDRKSVCEDLKRAREEEKEASKNRHQAG